MPKSSPSERSDLYVVRLQGEESRGAPTATLDTFPMSKKMSKEYQVARWGPYVPYLELGRGKVVRFEA